MATRHRLTHAQVRQKLESVLGVFQKLLASRATDQQACKLLSSIFLAFDGAELQVACAYSSEVFGSACETV